MDAPQIPSVVYTAHVLLSFCHLLPTVFWAYVLAFLIAECGTLDLSGDVHEPCFGPIQLLFLLITMIPFSMFLAMMYVGTVGTCCGGIKTEHQVCP